MADAFAAGGMEVRLDTKSGAQSVSSQDPRNQYDFPLRFADHDSSFDGETMNERSTTNPPSAPDGFSPMNWGAVAPYKDGEFPRDKLPTTRYVLGNVPD